MNAGKSIGAIIGVIIVLSILIIGAVYLLNNKSGNSPPANSQSAATAGSDELSDIEREATRFDLESSASIEKGL